MAFLGLTDKISPDHWREFAANLADVKAKRQISQRRYKKILKWGPQSTYNHLGDIVRDLIGNQEAVLRLQELLLRLGDPPTEASVLKKVTSQQSLRPDEKAFLDKIVLPIIDKINAGKPLTQRERNIGKLVGVAEPKPSKRVAPRRSRRGRPSRSSRRGRAYKGVQIPSELFNLIRDNKARTQFRRVGNFWEAKSRRGDAIARSMLGFQRQAKMVVQGARIENITNVVYTMLPEKERSKYAQSRPGWFKLKAPTKRGITLSPELFKFVLGSEAKAQFKKAGDLWEAKSKLGTAIAKNILASQNQARAVTRGAEMVDITNIAYVMLPKEYRDKYTQSRPGWFTLKQTLKSAAPAKPVTPPPTVPPPPKEVPKPKPSVEAKAVTGIIKESPEAQEIAVQALIRAGKPQPVAVREVREIVMRGKPASNVVKEAVQEAAPPQVLENKIAEVKRAQIPILPLAFGALALLFLVKGGRHVSTS